jgi:hypothetical protein
MATNFDIPVCPNHTDGRCPRSDTFVEREKDDCFVIRCRTCGVPNVWPKDRTERQGRHEAKLRQNMLDEQKEQALRRKRAYSI